MRLNGRDGGEWRHLHQCRDSLPQRRQGRQRQGRGYRCWAERATVWTDCDKLLLRKRAIIESVNDQLMNLRQIEQTRHRRPANFLVHRECGLIAYCHRPRKPALHLDSNLDALPAA